MIPRSPTQRIPHSPRPRCYLCKGRRVVVDPAVVDWIALLPCPACSHRDPPTARHQGPDVDLEVAA